MNEETKTEVLLTDEKIRAEINKMMTEVSK